MVQLLKQTQKFIELLRFFISNDNSALLKIPLVLYQHLERARTMSAFDHYDIDGTSYSVTTTSGNHVEGTFNIPSTTSNNTFDSYFSMDIDLENRTASCKSMITSGNVDF